MGCNNSKGSRPEQRGPRIQPPTGRSVPPPQSLIRVKLVLLGATGVGKSCLVLRYVKGLFEAASRVTVGAAFLAHSVSLPDGRTVKFEIWDTAGQERYASLAPLYYRGAGAAVVMYDITSAETFTKAKYWVTELQKNAPDNLVIVLAGNKSDLAEARQVTTEEGQAYAASNAMMFLETSAKTAANVAAVFDAIARQLAGAGGPPSGPSIPSLQNTPPPISTRPTSKTPGRSPSTSGAHAQQQKQEKGVSSSPAAASAAPAGKQASIPTSVAATEGSSPASTPASGRADKGSETKQQQLHGSAASLSSNQSAASLASDAASDPLPPSSDANILDPPTVSSQPPVILGATDGKQAASPNQDSSEPTDSSAAAGSTNMASEPDHDLPAAPQKAEARSAAVAVSDKADRGQEPTANDKSDDDAGPHFALHVKPARSNDPHNEI
ncbi:hypothetical protein WJX84_003234 [Apatococcus fuscideae]|uniref:Rab5 n=1 Tax=Apatococcus fuscideae TaxID=2026836 RepID=A0AAW1RIK7_9CHLO